MDPRIAQTIYRVGTLVSGVLGIFLLWNGIDSPTADAVDKIVTGLGVLVTGTGGLGVASVRTTRQINDGTLSQDPAMVVANGLQQLAAQKAAAEQGLATVTQVAQDVLGVIPGGAALQKDIAAAASALGAVGVPLPTQLYSG